MVHGKLCSKRAFTVLHHHPLATHWIMLWIMLLVSMNTIFCVNAVQIEPNTTKIYCNCNIMDIESGSTHGAHAPTFQGILRKAPLLSLYTCPLLLVRVLLNACAPILLMHPTSLWIMFLMLYHLLHFCSYGIQSMSSSSISLLLIEESVNNI